MRDSGGAVAFWPCPLDKWRISINHLLDVRLDSAIFVLKVPGGVLVNNVADEGVDCGLFCFGAVAGIHQPDGDAFLVVGFLCGLVLVVLVKEHHVGEGSGFDVARELLHVVDRVSEPPAFVVVVAPVDGVRRLIGAAVTHFDAERDFVSLVGDVVEDGRKFFLAANGVVPFLDLAYFGDRDLRAPSPLFLLRDCLPRACTHCITILVGWRAVGAWLWYDCCVGSPMWRDGSKREDMERMGATTVDELRSVWAGVRVDDVCAVDRVLRTGVEINRSPVETASYVFASDASLRSVAAGRRNLPGVFVDVLAGDSNEGVVVALLRVHADRVSDEALAEVIRFGFFADIVLW